MKWFKHQVTARHDEKLAVLEDRCGLEGYGFYFKMLEIVAEVIDATDKHEVIYSLTRWGRQTNITSKKFLFLSQCCSDVGLMSVCRLPDETATSDCRIAIKIPNLLKYRDNHTRNLQATGKQEEDKEEDKEREVDKKKSEKKNNTETPVAAFALPDWINKSDWELWIKTRKGKKMIPDQMQAQVNKLAKWRNDGLDHAKALADAASAGWQGLFEPKKSAGGTNPVGDQAREGARERLFGGKSHAAA